mmetsp:Transcript_57104/g.113430  ORF Transcript_57104/g.113430 Transcript_57104/m.113430 type:complete len:136 (-) Transcript_57104:363-770(-)|eukprot:CAMPEP_0174727242 /NCGR_PEP_ID=MMETSP1094-20130205/49379_1 /TAXON_ID=156173 /ORGANISM="Chrysochromulina brevifilum, Strain UTEX LB 985" /LENGTH=135 /DNA_ID=CAMNT_0015928935 /DNA_START=268 /DNA_END=675 /DNA_ORIENTATION=-
MIPAYLEAEAELRSSGIDEVIFYCVNDPHVMEAWARDMNIAKTMITFLADPEALLTKALGTVLDDVKVLRGPLNNLGYPRSKRVALIVDRGKILVGKISGTPEDPAGDDDPSETLPASMLASIPWPKDAPGGLYD